MSNKNDERLWISRLYFLTSLWKRDSFSLLYIYNGNYVRLQEGIDGKMITSQNVLYCIWSDYISLFYLDALAKSILVINSVCNLQPLKLYYCPDDFIFHFISIRMKLCPFHVDTPWLIAIIIICVIVSLNYGCKISMTKQKHPLMSNNLRKFRLAVKIRGHFHCKNRLKGFFSFYRMTAMWCVSTGVPEPKTLIMSELLWIPGLWVNWCLSSLKISIQQWKQSMEMWY